MFFVSFRSRVNRFLLRIQWPNSQNDSSPCLRFAAYYLTSWLNWEASWYQIILATHPLFTFSHQASTVSKISSSFSTDKSWWIGSYTLHVMVSVIATCLSLWTVAENNGKTPGAGIEYSSTDPQCLGQYDVHWDCFQTQAWSWNGSCFFYQSYCDGALL